MKKLLLILALTLSANAWAEFKTIDCSPWSVDGTLIPKPQRITFDPELPDAEILFSSSPNQEPKDGVCWKHCKTAPVKVTAFPSYYRFAWRVEGSCFKDEETGRVNSFCGKIIYNATLDLNRKDLSYTKKKSWIRASDLNSEGTGMCKLVEIDTSENIL